MREARFLTWQGVAGALEMDVLEHAYEFSIGNFELCIRRQGTELRSRIACSCAPAGAAVPTSRRRMLDFQRGAQGPVLETAIYLPDRGMALAGSDTLAYQKQPAPVSPAHVQLLVKREIPIVECLALRQLGAARCYEFLFVA